MKMSMWTFVSILCGSVILAALILLILGVILYCLYRKSRRHNDYVQLHNYNQSQSTLVNLQTEHIGNTEEGLAEAIQRQATEREQQQKEAALLSCQFYLRSITEFLLECHLPDIGSRVSKNWFIVRQIRRTTSILLTMLPVSQQCRLNLTEDKYTLRRLLKSLEHMNIHQIHDIDYIPDRKLVIILEPFHTRGSLKDLIYQTTPNLSWSTKYSVRRNGLKWKQVQSFGRQILHGVLFLHHLGFKPLGQIQSGNVYLEGGTIKLSGYENQLLGYKPRIGRVVKEYKNRIDSVMFGHLIYELTSGYELSTSKPSEQDLAIMKYAEIREVLKFIFYNEERVVPSIEEILKHPFFCDQNSPGLDHWSYEGVRFDEDMKLLLSKSRSGKLSKGTRSIPTGKRRQKSIPSRYPIFQHPGSSTLPTIAQSPNTTEPFMKSAGNNDKGQQKNLKNIPENQSKTESQDRSALLGDIRTGTALRKTETKDRSAPILH